MIAYFLPDSIAEDIAVEDGEDPEELHLTVLYLGKADQYTDAQIETLKNRVESFASKYAPIQGEIGGVGRFPASPSSDALDVIIRLVDAPRLEALREALIKELRSIQVEPILTHGYTPHVTLAYVGPDYEGVCTHPESFSISIDGLTCSIGRDQFTYPMNGSGVVKAGASDQGVFKMDDLSDGFPDVAQDLNSRSVTLSGEVIKADKAKQLVFGWASIVEQGGKSVVDKQGDVISEDEMEKMAYKFTLTSRTAGEMHEKVGVGKLVESIAFTKEKQKALGIDLGKVGWWLGFKVTDNNVWNKIEKGEYKSFSIHGKGVRERIKE